jgi:hypothetical protein
MERAVSEIFSPAHAADTKHYARTHAENGKGALSAQRGSPVTENAPFEMLLVKLCCFHRQAQFSFRRVQVFLGLNTVTVHVIVIGRARAFHFMDRLDHVFVNVIEIVPVMNPLCAN